MWRTARRRSLRAARTTRSGGTGDRPISLSYFRAAIDGNLWWACCAESMSFAVSERFRSRRGIVAKVSEQALKFLAVPQ